MNNFWTYYLVGALTTSIVAYFLILQPAIRIILTEHTNSEGGKMVLRSRLLVSVVFLILVFIFFPFVLPAVIVERINRNFINNFVSGIVSND